MPNQPEYHTIAEYMKAFDRMFLFMPDEMAAEHKHEIELHLRQLAQQSLLEGMPEEEAERQAIETFGPPREVASPLVMRWLKTTDPIATSGTRKRQDTLAVLISVLPYVLLPSLVGFPLPPRGILIYLILGLGLAAGILRALFAGPERREQLPEPIAAKLRHTCEELVNVELPRNAKPTVRLCHWVRRWYYQAGLENLNISSKKPPTVLNLGTLVGCGIAVLALSFLPIMAGMIVALPLFDSLGYKIAGLVRYQLTQHTADN